MMQNLILVVLLGCTTLAIGSISLLRRRPDAVLFPLSAGDEEIHQKEAELRQLRRSVWQARLPVLRFVWITLPPPSLHPLTRTELIIRDALSFGVLALWIGIMTGGILLLPAAK